MAKKKSGSGGSSASMMVDLTLNNYSQSIIASQGAGEFDSVMYFVIPSGLTEETCSKALMTSYKLSMDLCLNAKLMTEEEVKGMKPKPGNIFVLDPFSGPAFNFLSQLCLKPKSKFLVMGPQCIQHATQQMESGSIVSKGFPFYTMSMRNICITLTGFDKDEQKELTDLVQLMNGMSSKPFALSTTHVVAKKIITPKCYQAFESEVPVMTPDWIHAVWKEGKGRIVDATDPNFAKYACGIFYNVNICVSQVPSNVKNVIERVIVNGGGFYSKNFQRHKTDVLIIPFAGGEKYKYAVEWKVPVVTPEWVDKSKEAGHVLPFEKFIPSCRNILSSTQISGVDPRLPNFEGVSMLSAVGELSERSNIDPSAITDVTMSSAEKEEVKKDDIKLIEDAETFLDGCTVYLCCHDNEKLNALRRALNGSGAFRPNDLSDRVTHIIVVNELISDKEIKAIRTLGSTIPIVSMDWVLDCARQGCVVEAEVYAIDLKKYDDEPTLSSRTRPSDQAPRHQSHRSPDIPEPTARGSSSRSSKDKVDQNASVFQAPECVERRKSASNNIVEEDDPLPVAAVEPGSAAEGPIVLAGLAFVVKLESPEETVRISRLIRESGGEVIKENEESEEPIAILPAVYEPQSVHALRAFTKYWVEDVCDQQTLDITESVHHTPFQADENLDKILDGVVIATSAYSSHIKEYICVLSTHLGAIVQETFCRKNKDQNLRTTHLLCNVTDNDKFRAAQRWGTPVVFCEWITECFKKKKRLDHVDFLVSPDSDSTNSVYMKTPKGEKVWPRGTSGLSVMAGTAKKKGAISRVLASELQPSNRCESTTDGSTFKTPVRVQKLAAAPVETSVESPLIRDGMSREASRQLKRALDWAAADSFEEPRTPGDDEQRARAFAQPRKSTPLRKIMDSVDDILLQRAAEMRQKLGLPQRDVPAELKAAEEDDEEVAPPAQDSGLGANEMPDEDEANADSRQSKRAKVMSAPGKRNTESTGENSTGYSTLGGSRKGSTVSSTPSNLAVNRISPSQAHKFGGLLDDMVAAGDTHADEDKPVGWNGGHEVPAEPQPVPQKESTPPPATRKVESEKVAGGGYIKTRRGTASNGPNTSKPPSAAKSSARKGSSAIPKKTSQPKRRKAFVFAISGGTTDDKEKYKEVLERFGATVSTADFYDKASDALIASKVARSEKILGSIAGGKPILHPSYIDACEVEGKLLEFDDYLWGEQHVSTESERNMTRVAQYWYRRLQENPEDSPYAKFIVCLCEEKAGKKAAYTRLIEAGGGRVVPEDHPEMNIVIGEARDAVRISEEHQKPLKIPMFLNDVILTCDDPRNQVL